MHKSILAIVTLLCAIPLLAYGDLSQQINTWVQSPGGQLTVNGAYAKGSGLANPTVLTSKNGSQFYNYSTAGGAGNVATITLSPFENYMINSVTIDGQSMIAGGTTATGITYNAGTKVINLTANTDYANGAIPAIWVTFLRAQLSFTVNPGTGYIVFPSGVQPNVYSGPTYRVFEFIPAKGQYISAITPSSSSNMAYTTDPAVLPAAVNQKVIVTVSSITGTATLSATVGGTVATSSMTTAAAARTCDACHLAQGLDNGTAVATNTAATNAIFGTWSGGIHKAAGLFCSDCHAGSNTGAHPGQINTTLCVTCHGGTTTPDGNPHSNSSTAPVAGGSCIACHALPRDAKGIASANNASGLYVQDNNGVRAVVGEFSRWSHHVTGVTLDDAHCVACHKEGTIGAVTANGVTTQQVLIDPANHMHDNSVHLRDVTAANNDATITWTPDSTTPEFGNLDTFCMNCHSAAGAQSPVSLQVQAYINANGLAATGKTAQPSNPFGDTISNQYDLIQRPAVVDVDDQFNTTNPSHHAVKGKRYSGRTRTGGYRAVSNSAGSSTFDASATVAGGTGLGCRFFIRNLAWQAFNPVRRRQVPKRLHDLWNNRRRYRKLPG